MTQRSRLPFAVHADIVSSPVISSFVFRPAQQRCAKSTFRKFFSLRPMRMPEAPVRTVSRITPGSMAAVMKGVELVAVTGQFDGIALCR